jgi:aldehyde dehydrogenase (NAD+)
MDKQIRELVERQRGLFRTGATVPLETRETALRALAEGIRLHEGEILAALKADLGKSAEESYMTEIGMTLGEISFMLKNLRRLAARRPVRTPLTHYVARCYEQPCPLGTVLIISPWNYPFLLTVEPLVDALAAGNTAIVKPSAYSPATSDVIATLLDQLFPEDYVTCVQGGREQNSELLDQDFDLVFFTGSQAVGKVVLEKSAAHLTPAVLELGGKSPCIVDATAKIPLAARRIAWGKFLNCGQTCVAPDYVLCDRRIQSQLVDALRTEIRRQFGKSPLGNESYGNIVNAKHFERLSALLDTGTLAHGGRCNRDALKIEPTLMVDVAWDDPIMQEEIFGPILSIVTYKTLDEALERIAERPKPLALYLFSQDKATINRVMTSCRFGGGCINDTVIHLATSTMRFGGVGESGMGSYHGEAGFNAFSHVKSIVDRKTWVDAPMRYQPYNRVNSLLVKLFLH